MHARTSLKSSAPAAPVFQAKLRTPFATVGIATDGRAVTRVAYLPASEREAAPTDAIAERAAREIEGYLEDPGFHFGVPLAPKGTPFQRRAWDAIAAIPPGESRTYGEIASRLVTAPRAVGQACGANPLALIVPCHRVVASLGALGGFMGTLGTESIFVPSIGSGSAPRDATAETLSPAAIKRWLLTHEGYRFGR
jgi:methylated-DNA-[protein]-cysteine S-methyltransferase